MKKYLFLIILFFIYLILKYNNSNMTVSNTNIDNKALTTINLKFNNNINSNKLKEIFETYNEDYYIKNITYNKKETNITCSSIENCIEKIFNKENESFNLSYIVNGFAISDIKILTHKDHLIKLLNDNNINYKIKQP